MNILLYLYSVPMYENLSKYRTIIFSSTHENEDNILSHTNSEMYHFSGNQQSYNLTLQRYTQNKIS